MTLTAALRRIAGRQARMLKRRRWSRWLVPATYGALNEVFPAGPNTGFRTWLAMPGDREARDWVVA